jgi:hypothetical protein
VIDQVHLSSKEKIKVMFSLILTPAKTAGLLSLIFFISACGNDTAETELVSEQRAAELVDQILDEDMEVEQRRELVEDHPELAVEMLNALVRDLEPGSEEEARRIPWIWRVTIAAGSRNDAEEIRQIMEASLPQVNEPLFNWQCVVLGGGVVNGISRQGIWPKPRINEILEDESSLQDRWQHAVNESYDYAANPDLPYPWRYDALRMTAMDETDRSIPELAGYLEAGLNDHLHMGALRGLSDIQSPEVPGLILENISNYSESNYNIALEVMMHTEERREALRSAVEEGIIDIEDLNSEQVETLGL